MQEILTSMNDLDLERFNTSLKMKQVEVVLLR